MRRYILSLLAALASVSPSMAGQLLQPTLRLPASTDGKVRVALTFDACSGATDQRILTALVDHKIPAAFMVTGRWLRRNQAAIAVLKAHPELFEIEDHGARHVPAVDIPMTIYGIKAAGSPQAVKAEVLGGADAAVAAGFSRPKWFRGATAEYTRSSIAEIEAEGFHIAGFSLNGDFGATLGAKSVAHRYESARDGEVIISHINQPTHPSGAGVVAGILALKARGVEFVKLDDVANVSNLHVGAGPS